MPTLTTLTALKRHAGIAASDVALDDSLAQWLDEAEALIRRYCRQEFRCPPATTTEYQTTHNTRFQRARQRPVRAFLLDATLVANSATVTVADTSELQAGMPVGNAGLTTSEGLPGGCTISAVTSATTFAASAASATAGSYTLYAGAAAWLDRTGFYGAGNNAFAALARLNPGVDFLVVPDQADGTSLSGILERLNGIWPAAVEFNRGLLAPSMVPAKGCLKLTYTHGFQVGQVPADLVLAVHLVAANLRSMRRGAPLNSESYDGYSYSLGRGRKAQDPLEPALSILEKYRDRSTGL